jgi:hypothetical protein
MIDIVFCQECLNELRAGELVTIETPDPQAVKETLTALGITDAEYGRLRIVKPRKPYTPPTLRSLGSVNKITLASGPSPGRRMPNL